VKALTVFLFLTIVSYVGISCDDGTKVDGEPPSVSGAVVDSTTGAVLDSVMILHVTSSGRDFLTVTDQYGHYSFGLRFGSSTYLFQRAGYKEKQFLLPNEAQRISDYKFELDVALVIR
jgi:hypothetical protein